MDHQEELKVELEPTRLLARQLGRMLNDDELDSVAGGYTCTCCSGGDCDYSAL